MTAESGIIFFGFISVTELLPGECYLNKKRTNPDVLLNLLDLFHRKIPFHDNYLFIKATSVHRRC